MKVTKNQVGFAVSIGHGIWRDISGNRATTGCVHICYLKNIEKAGKEFVNIVNNEPYPAVTLSPAT